MPDIDPISEMLGALKATTDRTADLVDIIRQDQISSRREMDFLKSNIVDTREMVDTSATTIKAHNDVIVRVAPLLPTLENIDTGRKVTKWGLLAIVTLGGANLLVPAWSYIKSILGVSPHIGTGP